MKNIFGSLPRLNDLPPSNFFRRLLFVSTLLTIAFAGTAMSQMAFADMVSANYKIATKEPASVYAIELRVFDLINEERSKNGRQPLTWTEKAATAARFHSATMADGSFLGHEDLTGRKVDDRAEQFGIKDWRRIGENVAWIKGHDDPAARVVECWMRSPGHRDNLLDANFRETGLGLVVSKDGKYYFTQVFVKRK